MFKTFHSVRTVSKVFLMMWVLVLAQLANAQRPEPPPIEERRYEDNFTFKYGTSFSKDPWTWGYTKEFAERFRMPEQWIEPEMKGILAIAFRVTDMGQISACGLGGREDNCWTSAICQFDIYYDNSIKLPWIKEAVTRDTIISGISSKKFLWERPTQQEIRYDANPYWPNRGPNSDNGPLPLRIGFTSMERKAWHFPAAFTYYDKEYAPGIGLIGIQEGACQVPFRKGDYWLGAFANKDAQEKSKDQPRNQLKSTGLVHEAVIPESFMKRAELARERNTQEQGQVTERLIREFQQRQQGATQSK
jgi:hypothetical protein